MPFTRSRTTEATFPVTSAALPQPAFRSLAPSARQRAVLLALSVGVGLLGVGYALDVARGMNRMPRNLEIEGVAVGGLSDAAATRKLQAALAEPGRTPIKAAADGIAISVDPRKAGLAADLQRTFDKARSRSLTPFVRLASLVRSSSMRVVTAADEPTLRAELERVSQTVNRSPHEGAVRFDGATPLAVPPQAGRALDLDAAVRTIAAAYLRPQSGPVQLAVRTTAVKTTDADVQKAMAEIAAPAVAAPVRLHVGTGEVMLLPRTIAKMLRIEADSAGVIVASIKAEDLDEAVGDELAPLETKAKDASFRLSGGKPVILASATGREVDRTALATNLLPLLRRPAPRELGVDLVTTQPKLTTERARELGIKEVVSSFTTAHPCCRPRVQNIHKMADIVQGAVVLPGETFSLNGHVGERDAKRGFVPAPMILDGDFVDAIGGGVSQFATTMFNAVFFGGFEDVFHKPHSYYITRYPEGREATVSSPSPDLKWKNDSPYGVYIQTAYTGKTITVTFWSTKVWDITAEKGERTRVKDFPTKYDNKPTCTSISGYQGFDVVVTRIFKKNGQEVRRERFTTRYLPEPKIICGDPPASPSPSSSASPSPSPAPSPSSTALS